MVELKKYDDRHTKVLGDDLDFINRIEDYTVNELFELKHQIISNIHAYTIKAIKSEFDSKETYHEAFIYTDFDAVINGKVTVDSKKSYCELKASDDKISSKMYENDIKFLELQLEYIDNMLAFKYHELEYNKESDV